MKIIITIALTLAIVFGVKVYAGTEAGQGMVHVDTLSLNSLGAVRKIYDSNNEVTCYVYAGHGISCIK